MMPYRFPRPARLALFALAAAILMVLCVVPQQDLPDAPAGDRVHHLVAWFVLTLTGYVLAPNRRIAIPAFALAYGALVEVVQRLTPTGRHGEWQDFVADALGVALAVLVFPLVRRVSARVIDAV
jgi:VanZ family protein